MHNETVKIQNIGEISIIIKTSERLTNKVVDKSNERVEDGVH